ncbi:MAG: alpha-N-arabinofuranosidase, partial [Anaerolineae bacterium]|nr:alpha-N-arabinofuranosidase [Anaerolineae bacterium]
EVYNLEDALVVAGFLNSFIRHADSVKIANIAQIVNVIAPILTRGDEMLLQSIFYPFEMFATRGTGVALQTVVDGPTYTGKTYGDVTTIDTSAILNGDTLQVFATNRSLTAAAEFEIVLVDRAIAGFSSGEVLTGPDPKAANSYEQPDLVTAGPLHSVEIKDGVATVTLPPLSVAAMTLNLGA